ncbi:lipoprotein releasing system transmembrane protein LolE [Ketogulonicigenium vulgare Y25]|uniref:ABC transporter, permease protein n=1 Tax=Ketogulonicigenium vulgare (strain WSH-001) TaxID=759362 RepID=F9Y9W2_KETVW|nr:lipoprotein-releasing ABC transporter permease subunit [Ketogulonicigenium vulgare]ADO41994.1 lipoprotein releasing system transmembrane protein LolE [Ketogulonicigenium vulgare Y25]AEM40214.1 ABC transporter, permease protein [Ketogulonicigenium vulgare WSH-001]ALJ80416.1 ABC transporter substrate-binding protein [Ketogulonicigenium vulgare]AOZ53918.1 lipoprotein releasing system transmembrane protein LolE [Ketogulonicigenium vulgare]
MAQSTLPFARFEWMIAWRYLRARKAEGGVSVMTWISLIGVTLAVFALVATLAIREGFREEFVDSILGANAHVTMMQYPVMDSAGSNDRTITDYQAMAADLAAVPGVTRAAPLVRATALATAGQYNAPVDIYGISAADLATIPSIADPANQQGSLADFEGGVAIGSGVAQSLGLQVGDSIRITSPNGARTPMGVVPRANAYTVTMIFSAGRYDIDRVRLYMPLADAQSFLNRDGVADEIEVMVADPENVDAIVPALMNAAGPRAMPWTWKDSAGAYLRALTIEDNVMFVLLSILVLIAAMNIISGLVMLVKNKGRDIGILRTMGLSEGSVLRIFFICGASIGTIGTLVGVALGALFALYIDPIFAMVNTVAGGGVWDPSVRGIYHLPAKLQWHNIASAMGLSLGLSWIVTIFPARRAARMNPIEALRYE